MSNGWWNRLLFFAKALGIIVICILSSVLGSALTRNFGVANVTISYVDFISITLTAVSVLITILAIFLAGLGFVGWATIEQKVHSKTEEFLVDGFETGGRLDKVVVDMMEQKIEKIMYEGVQQINELGSDRNKGIKK